MKKNMAKLYASALETTRTFFLCSLGFKEKITDKWAKKEAICHS